jgi:hypothetical protein
VRLTARNGRPIDHRGNVVPTPDQHHEIAAHRVVATHQAKNLHKARLARLLAIRGNQPTVAQPAQQRGRFSVVDAWAESRKRGS